MLRFAAIISLIFYISVSIGVHVDVDTCCKTIAGLSILGDSGNHGQALIDDCCATDGDMSCHEEAPEGCPSDCVYIQVIMDTPPPAYTSLQAIPTPMDIELIAELLAISSTAPISITTPSFDKPPTLAIQEELYLSQGAFITYA